MKRAFAIVVAMLRGFGAFAQSLQPFTVVHTFTNADGSAPYAGLTASGSALFGTTKSGGNYGDGVVFRVNTDGSGFGVLHNFSGPDGAGLVSDLFLANDLLFGTASQGGAANSQGALFSLAPDGSSFTNGHIFSGAPNGSTPKAGLLLSGNMLYGTTSSGAVYGIDGTVFSVETNGPNFTTLHTFTGTDGSGPAGDLVLGDNVLYGTTSSGGVSNLGTIFSIETNGANFTLLHSFLLTDGTNPVAGLVLSGGTLYGTAADGGAYGIGTVFSIRTNGANFTVLRSFFHTAVANSTDGAVPRAALCLSHKVLYGTTCAGGVYGEGTLFSIDPDGSNYTQLFSFGGNSLDGIVPFAPLIAIGNWIYGTTSAGGAGQSGTVFGLQVRGVAFTSAPAGETNVSVNSEVFFGTSAFSLTAPTATVQYQWRLNGVNIPGATTEGLSFNNVQPTNGGSLTMTVSDGTDAATSVPVGFSVAIRTTASGNDNFAGRFMLGQAASGVVRSSNTNATLQSGEPQILAGVPGGKSIWFQWQPTNSGTAVFSTQGSDFDTIMGAYTGTGINSLTRVHSAVNDDDYGGYLTSKLSFDCSAGTAYEIVVDGYRGASGNVVLSWVTQNFAEALPAILRVPRRLTITSNGAAVNLVCAPDSGAVTWLFNGRATGVVGTNYEIGAVGEQDVGTYVAQVSAGGGVTSTEPVHLQINVLQDGTSDPGSIAWNKFLDSASAAYRNPPQPSIRKLGGGGDTRGYSVAQTFSTIGATGEPGEPSIAGQIGGSPVWYTYITPTNGTLVIDTGGSSFDTLLGVFAGPGDSFATLTNVAAGFTTNWVLDGQPQVFIPDVATGQTNFIVVDGYGGASGTVHLNINLGDPALIGMPPQNQFVVAGNSATFTVGASGTIPLSYLWQFNSTNIAGATSQSLTVTNAQAANAGLYTVVVSNLFAVAGASATLSLPNPLRLAAPSLNGGAFQLQLLGPAGGTYVLQASTNLVTWTPLVTNNAASGFLLLTDTNAGKFKSRFYRGVTH